MLITRVIHAIIRRVWLFVNVDKFGEFDRTAYVQKLLRIDGRENIYIKAQVIIQRQTWLAAVPLTGAKECNLTIDKGSVIGNFNHIYAINSIKIGKKVLTADKVYISDCAHDYRNIDLAVVEQPIILLSPVVIGDGAWIGENVCVLGASVGKGSVVGANSVVLSDVPDYCVAVGAPAKVIKRYNFDTKQWEKVF